MSRISIPVVYLVLSHTEPVQTARLVDRLLRGDPEAHVVVDQDRAGPAFDGFIAAHPRLTVRSSERPGGWGGFGLTAATSQALSAVRRELDPDWTVLLSGQDYPAVSPGRVREQLAASSCDAHIEVVCELTGDDRGELRFWYARYFYRWWTLPAMPTPLPPTWRQRRINLEYRLSRAQSRAFIWTLPRGAGTRVGLRRTATPFSRDFPCWGASQWFAVSRRGLGVLDSERARRHDLVELYRRSVIPDESMLQTLLLNAADLDIHRENLTFQRWGGRDNAHAAVLDLADLDAILASGRPFVRKVDPSRSADLMDELDARIGLAPPAV